MKLHTLSFFAILLAISLISPGTAFAQANAAPLLTTITNPTPADSDIFGGAVAAIGSDRLLVGAEGANEAYLFNVNGMLVKTFTISDPSAGSFGAALAPVGSDRVVIGAYNYTAGATLAQIGRAYLFAANGTLLVTFTNPSPTTVQAFGFSVAAVGNDHVLIGAGGGGPFLFKTNGVLETTFVKPGAGLFANFGTSLTAVGSDRLFIGAPDDNTGATGAGSAYLFRTNGTLLTTFTNPVPVAGDNFGNSVAAIGSDLLLVSAIDSGGVKGTGGTAYLFSTNGTLLSTFNNPTPGAYDYFGWSVAAVGSTRVLIGALQDGTGAFQAGSVYLFSTNGTLLNTFTNPSPANQTWFGYSVAAAGSDRIIIGEVWDNTGANHAGSAHVFDLPYPRLNITRDAGTASITWVTSENGLILQQADLLGTSPAWSDTTNMVLLNGMTNVVRQTIATGRSSRYFRLRRP
jgi:hypothetical protein